MRPGVRLAVDLGERRIGVARSDATATLAVPVTTVARGAGDVAALIALVSEYEAVEMLVGLPLALDGSEGPAARGVREFTGGLAASAPCPVRLVDERLTTASAQRSLHAAGRSVKGSRQVIDQQAAVEILQSALDLERATGMPPGEEVAR